MIFPSSISGKVENKVGLESNIVRNHAFTYPTIMINADRGVLDSCYPMARNDRVKKQDTVRSNTSKKLVRG